MYNNILESLGFIGAMIVFIAIISSFFFIERLYYINMISINVPNFVDGIINLLKNCKRNEALTLCEETESPITSIVRTCLMHRNDKIQNIEIKISGIATLEINILNKRLDLLKYLCFASSAFGLMGTLLSILDNFDEILHNNLRLDPILIASFFSYALNTTILGLFISIIIFTFHTYLTHKIKLMIHEMEWSSHKLIDYFIENK